MGVADRVGAMFRKSAPARSAASIALALQGGGALGAFTRGALDALLADATITFDAVSGASAGAVNAVLLADGLIDGGREGARAKLESFWRRMSRGASFMPRGPLVAPAFELFMRNLAPAQFNPLDLNPLRDALAEEIDFERLRARPQINLVIAATRVRDGRARFFETAEITLDAVLASACLPALNHAVVIDGETYWDGGYVANPPLRALAQISKADELLIVQLTPAVVETMPSTPSEITRRLEQIRFNAPLNAELESLTRGKLFGATPRLKRLRISRISAQEEIDDVAEASGADLRWSVLERLRDGGRAAAQGWIARRHAATR